MAWTYDLVAWSVSLGMWKDWVESIVPEVSGPRVLELGHGPGHLQINLLASGVSVYGLDSSPQMGRLARRRISASGYEPKLIKGIGQQLPFPSNSFDTLIATFPTEYIFEAFTLSEVRRVLVPGGKLVIIPVAWITGNSLLQRAAALLFRITGQAGEWDKKYLEPFKNAGFIVELKRKKVRTSAVLTIVSSKPSD